MIVFCGKVGIGTSERSVVESLIYSVIVLGEKVRRILRESWVVERVIYSLIVLCVKVLRRL